MNDPQFQQHGGPHASEHLPHKPYRRPIHHTPFFWVAVVFIMAAMIIYVTTNDLAFMPGKRMQRPMPALAP